MRHRSEEGQPIQRRFLYRSPATHQPQAQFGILGSFRRKFVKLASRTTLRFSRYTLPFPEFSSILDISTSIDAAGCCDHLTMDRALFKTCSFLGRTQAFLPGAGESLFQSMNTLRANKGSPFIISRPLPFLLRLSPHFSL